MHRCRNRVSACRGTRFLKQRNKPFQVNALSRNTLGDAMTELLALSVSVAVLGGIWAFIALGPLGGFALVWVGFIAAGCFFAAGGDRTSSCSDAPSLTTFADQFAPDGLPKGAD
jgi:hypothetical protein